MTATEDIGVTVPLGRWVLREACRQMKNWMDDDVAPPVIAVNLSAGQIRTHTELQQDLQSILAETGLAPENVEFEITENALMEASREHQDVLLRIEEAGLRIAVDDFGAGYSSLDRLSRLPISRLNIAQKFVRDLAEHPYHASIIKAAIAIAREMGLTLVAKGVETEQELELVASFGCRQIQGWYCSKPLEAGDLTSLLRSRKVADTRPSRVESTLLH